MVYTIAVAPSTVDFHFMLCIISDQYRVIFFINTNMIIQRQDRVSIYRILLTDNNMAVSADPV